MNKFIFLFKMNIYLNKVSLEKMEQLKNRFIKLLRQEFGDIIFTNVILINDNYPDAYLKIKKCFNINDDILLLNKLKKYIYICPFNQLLNIYIQKMLDILIFYIKPYSESQIYIKEGYPCFSLDKNRYCLLLPLLSKNTFHYKNIKNIYDSIPYILNNQTKIYNFNNSKIYKSIIDPFLFIIGTEKELLNPEILKYGYKINEIISYEHNINFSWKLTYNLNELKSWGHRAGWLNVMEHIYYNSNLNSKNKYLLIDFIEKTFAWNFEVLPNENFIGFWHNPHNMPKWFNYHASPQSILEKKDIFNCLIKYCKGIFVFSNYLATYLKSRLPNIEINVCIHPTEIVKNKFTWKNYINNQDKKLLQIGYWLRKMSFIYQIKTNKFKKYWLYGTEHLSLFKDEIINENISLDLSSVHLIRLSNQDYDTWLTCNICVLYLYDTSINNTVIECLVRHCPLIINKHPAIVEILGDNYPLYYQSLEECQNFIENDDLLYKGYLYIKNLQPENIYTMSNFINSFYNSNIIQNLPKVKMR